MHIPAGKSKSFALEYCQKYGGRNGPSLKFFKIKNKVFKIKKKVFKIKNKVFRIKNTQTQSRTRKHDQEHANTIKNTQTRSKHVRARSKFLFQNCEKIFEDKKEHTQLTIKLC